MGAALYLPDAWTTDPTRCAAARIPQTVRFQEKWRLALTLVRRTRAAGVTLTAVVADAEYGDNSTVRQALHRLRLPYALGISPTLTVFRGTPTLRFDRTQPRPRNRRQGWPDQEAVGVRTLSEALPARAWRRVTWRNGTNPPWTADFAAIRGTPATDWRHRRLAPEVWLLCERGLGPTGRRRHYLVSLPASASLKQLVRLAHHRWAIEQHYQDLKTELGLDHFEGRTYSGWQHHMAISAVAYAFVQAERIRPRPGPQLTFPQARAFVQEIFTGLLFVSRPRYMHWMKQAEQRFHQLRI
jgi:SRSO17 transposase